MGKRLQVLRTSAAPISLNCHTYNTRIVPVCSYVAQLIPLPCCFNAAERGALHTVLRMPTNALAHADMFQLQAIGGPHLRSLSASCASALFRTAFRTVTTWPTWLEQLKVAAERWQPLRPYVLNDMSPDFWDNIPIAANLATAYGGFLDDQRWIQGTTELLQFLASKNAGSVPMPGSSEALRIGEVQKKHYNLLVKSHLGSCVGDFIERRLIKLFHPYDLDFDSVIDLDACLSSLKCRHKADVIKIIKTWVNGWAPPGVSMRICAFPVSLAVLAIVMT